MDEWCECGREVPANHPVTFVQNARTSGGGNLAIVPVHAITVGPRETWRAEKVSI